MEAESWQSQQSHYFSALKTERNVMFLILTLIIVVAAFNIISNLMMIVQERNPRLQLCVHLVQQVEALCVYFALVVY